MGCGEVRAGGGGGGGGGGWVAGKFGQAGGLRNRSAHHHSAFRFFSARTSVLTSWPPSIVQPTASPCSGAIDSPPGNFSVKRLMSKAHYIHRSLTQKQGLTPNSS